MPGRWVAGLLVAASMAACGDRAHEGPAVSVRDSAGIELVDNFRPEWTEGRGPAWRVGANPLLRIGVVDGDPAYQLSMVTGAVALRGGGVAVADGGSQQVRFFDAAGRHLGTRGGTGGGPGEFTGLAGLGPGPNGGVWAYDFPLRRVTRLTLLGDLEGVDPLPPEPPTLNAVGMLPDGSLVLRQLWGARAVAGAEAAGLRRDPVAYVRFTGGSSADTLAWVPGREVYIQDEGGRGVMTTPLLPHNSVGAVRGDRLVVGSQDRFELDEYGADGRLLRRIRVPPGDLEVGPGDIDDYIDRYLRGVEPERRPAIRTMLEGLPPPGRRPAHGGLLVDRLGYLWVAEWTVLAEAPRQWTVLDPSGRWLGEVAMPGGFTPLDVGQDRVVGVMRDALDVEYVVAYPLDRGEGREGA